MGLVVNRGVLEKLSRPIRCGAGDVQTCSLVKKNWFGASGKFRNGMSFLDLLEAQIALENDNAVNRGWCSGTSW